MKKITLSVFAILAIAFYSCDTEPVGEDSLNSVEGKGKLKVKPVEEEVPCEVTVLPDLPSLVNACTTAKGLDANGTYFDLTINDTSLAGNYGAWCIDVDLSLGAPECFDAAVYSSYDPAIPASVVENPANWDLVNWILNQDFGSQGYSMGEIQWAIWELLDDANCFACTFLGAQGTDWNQADAQAIVDAAIANGEGYEPGEGNYLAIVLVPNNNRQPVVIPIKLECEPEPSCETAFARGNDGNTCFIDTGLFSRWGWSIGPLAEGTTESYEIYAGAGQCDISKGALVGTVDVEYVDGNVTVTYNIDGTYTVSETHTYAGNAMFPVDNNGEPTVAPGLYTVQEGLSGDIYVIAHAVVCSEE